MTPNDLSAKMREIAQKIYDQAQFDLNWLEKDHDRFDEYIGEMVDLFDSESEDREHENRELKQRVAELEHNNDASYWIRLNDIANETISVINAENKEYLVRIKELEKQLQREVAELKQQRQQDQERIEELPEDVKEFLKELRIAGEGGLPLIRKDAQDLLTKYRLIKKAQLNAKQ